MTKSEALKITGGSVKKLAQILGITHNAISQWRDDEEIPKLRQYELKEYLANEKNRPNHCSSV